MLVGFHPWATHAIKLDPTTSKRSHYCSVFLTPKSPASHQQILDEILTFLPEPTSLTELLVDLERRLRRWPRAQLGEVGLDKKARVPIPELFRNQVASNSNGQEIDKEEENLAWLRSRSLTPYVTSMDHQMAILQAQVDVLHRVVEDEGRSRCISLHAVGVSAPVDQLLSKWTKDWAGLPALIKVLLHSCGLSWEAWQSIEVCSPPSFLLLHLASIVECHSDYRVARSRRRGTLPTSTSPSPRFSSTPLDRPPNPVPRLPPSSHKSTKTASLSNPTIRICGRTSTLCGRWSRLLRKRACGVGIRTSGRH